MLNCFIKAQLDKTSIWVAKVDRLLPCSLVQARTSYARRAASWRVSLFYSSSLTKCHAMLPSRYHCNVLRIEFLAYTANHICPLHSRQPYQGRNPASSSIIATLCSRIRCSFSSDLPGSQHPWSICALPLQLERAGAEFCDKISNWANQVMCACDWMVAILF